MKTAVILLFSLLILNPGVAQEDPNFPVVPEVIVDDFNTGAEGLAFSQDGELYVTADRSLWHIGHDGTKTMLVKLDSNLGAAGYGERDVLVADFGSTNAFRHHRNSDGVVWRITPEGEKTAFIEGIGDPNAVLVRSDGQILVSDDATNEIFIRDLEGNLKLFTTAVNHPNGIALSADETKFYVAQIFKTIRPVVMDGTL